MPATEQSELLVFAYRFDENIRKKLWLEAWEQTHAEQLREKIASTQRATNDKKRVLAQLDSVLMYVQNRFVATLKN